MIIVFILLLLLLWKLNRIQNKNITSLVFIAFFLFLCILFIYQLVLLDNGLKDGLYGSDARLYFETTKKFVSGSVDYYSIFKFNGPFYILWNALFIKMSPFLSDFEIVLLIKLSNILLLILFSLNIYIFSVNNGLSRNRAKWIMILILCSGGFVYTAIRNLKEMLLLYILSEVLLLYISRFRYRVLLYIPTFILMHYLKPLSFIPFIISEIIRYRRFSYLFLFIILFASLFFLKPFNQYLDYLLIQYASEDFVSQYSPKGIEVNILEGPSVNVLSIFKASIIGIPRMLLFPLPIRYIEVLMQEKEEKTYYEGLETYILKLSQYILWLYFIIPLFLVNIRKFLNLKEDEVLKIIFLWFLVVYSVKLIGATDIREKLFLYFSVYYLCVKYFRWSKYFIYKVSIISIIVFFVDFFWVVITL